MKTLLLLFVLLVSVPSFAQLGGEDEVYLSENIMPPKFNGGDVTNFHKYVREHFDKSKIAKPGKMVAAFTINEKGEIENLRLTQFIDEISAAEFIRVLKNAPKWQPATKMGKPYAMKVTIPLEFR